MTVETEQSSEVFTGIVDGVPLNVPFPVQETTELKVRYSFDGADTLATLGVHYTVTLVPPGYLTGIVTPLTGFAVISGGTVSVRREVAYTQPTDVPTLAKLASSRLEQMCDRLTFMAQQLRDQLAYALKFPTTDVVATNIGILPNAADRASKYLGFDGNGKPIAVASTAGTSLFTAFGIAWGQLINAAAGRTALGVSSTAEANALYIPKALLTTIGDMLYASGVSTPARLGIGTAGQILGLAAGGPVWITPSIKLTVWTANATWTPDTNMRQALLFALASGSGAGATGATAATIGRGGGGGGAGSWAIKLTDKATAGATQSVTIGAVANGGAAGANNGSAGNDTSIGALCIGKGPAAGGSLSNGDGSTVSQGAPGGVAGTGDIRSTGEPGQGVGVYGAALSPGGFGGSSPFGGGGRGNIAIAGSAGSAGSGFGSGGSGGQSYNGSAAQPGGNSGPGLAFALEIVRP